MCIKFDIKILLFIVFFFIVNKLEIYLLFFSFIVLHELSHLLIAVILGGKPIMIELKPVGCSISLKYKIKDYNKKIIKGNLIELKKIFVYLAGPLFNFIVAIIALLLRANENITYINIILGIFNLICIYPLDGGRIVKCITTIFFGEEKAYKITLKISNLFLILILILSSILILRFHSFGIIIGILYLIYIKIIYSKAIKLKLRALYLIN